MEEAEEFPFTVTLHYSERFCHSSSPYHCSLVKQEHSTVRLLTTELLTYLGNTVPYLWQTFYYLHGVVLGT